MIEPINPSVWRSARPNTVRKINPVWIAGKQRWLYAASEPNLTTIGMHSLSPGPFPCNTLTIA